LREAWLVPSGQIHVDPAVLNDNQPKFCALTFDDGPDNQYTLAVMEVLDHYGIYGTFFVVGERIASHLDQIETLARHGHEIANHSYSHPDFTRLSASEQRKQLEQTNKAVEPLGIQMRWFRPPYGSFNQQTIKTASELGMETVLWTVDPRDWAQPGVQTIKARTLRNTIPGAVILLHSTNAQTAAALPEIIEALLGQGYEFLTMSQWRKAVSGEVMLKPRDLTPIAAPAAPSHSPSPSHTTTGRMNQSFYQPFDQTQDVPRVVEDLEARSVTDFAHVAWSEIVAVSQLLTPEERKTAKQATPETPVADIPVMPAGTLPVLPEGEEFISHPALDKPEAEATPVVESAPASTPSTPGEPSEQGPLGSALIDLVDLENEWTAWETPARIDPSRFYSRTQSSTGSPGAGSQYYFLSYVPSLDSYTWVELEMYVRLAKLNGLLMIAELEPVAPTCPLSYPYLAYYVSALDQGALVDLTTEGIPEVVDMLLKDKSNIFVVVRPQNLHFFMASHLWSEMHPNMRDFILFRQLTAGMQCDPATEYEAIWDLPPEVEVVKFTQDNRIVLVLFTRLKKQFSVTVPAECQHFSRAVIAPGGYLWIAPIHTAEVSISRSPVVLYYEWAEN